MAESIYRKYRPTTFDEVFGQDHITKTLKSQVESGRVGHAYLFTGSRGTGKTTSARILARAVNCLHPKNGSPCNECEVCKALSAPVNMDVVELDAASNNGVEDARQLREQVNYTPVHGKYKVFIIDEVHMLTSSAFNALLKTLEEPPSHVIFILATTDPQRLPATILSRVLRFDFHLVETDLLAKNIAEIFDKEGFKYEMDAVQLIAKLGEGSVRDSLSIADVCINVDGVLTLEKARALTGATDKTLIVKLLEFIANRDIVNAFALVNDLTNSGKKPLLIARELSRLARDILVVKEIGAESSARLSLVVEPTTVMDQYSTLAKGMSSDFLAGVLRDFAALENDMKYSASPVTCLETAIVTCVINNRADLSSVTERVAQLENKLYALSLNASSLKKIQNNSPEFDANAIANTNATANDLPDDLPIDDNLVPPEISHVSAALSGSEQVKSLKSGAAIVGAISRAFRQNKMDNLIKYLQDIKVNETDDALTLVANDDSFLPMCDPSVQKVIVKTLKEINITKELKIIKIGSEEIRATTQKARELFGEKSVRVINKPKTDK